ncbi:hypothetical protein LX32DRAFT_635788, partial [Colletotrichum zoysiae]
MWVWVWVWVSGWVLLGALSSSQLVPRRVVNCGVSSSDSFSVSFDQRWDAALEEDMKNGRKEKKTLEKI